ncbi:MAG: thioredoxin family protein [Rhodobacteraceae bacterium]|nr:thioredoxin family protein [Paracoccaceae bacterium]
MKTFKVLGSGCKKCANTADLIELKAKAAGVEIEIIKVTDMGEIMGYGVMSTPGVVLDEALVHAGGMPTPAQVEDWVKG